MDNRQKVRLHLDLFVGDLKTPYLHPSFRSRCAGHHPGRTTPNSSHRSATAVKTAGPGQGTSLRDLPRQNTQRHKLSDLPDPRAVSPPAGNGGLEYRARPSRPGAPTAAGRATQAPRHGSGVLGLIRGEETNHLHRASTPPRVTFPGRPGATTARRPSPSPPGPQGMLSADSTPRAAERLLPGLRSS